MKQAEIVFDGSVVAADAVAAIACGQALPVLGQSAGFVARIQAGASFLEILLEEDGVIYGVTTGYGDSCQTTVPADLVEKLPGQLYTFHGCGLGDVFSLEESRAILLARLASLCRGYSGVRYQLLEYIVQLLVRDIIPVIPQEGSVGASGDLTPLSYLAAVIEGKREVWFEGARRPTAAVYEQLAIAPLLLRPKEGLAIMNGTAVMTGIACLALRRAAYAARLAARVTSLSSLALQGNSFHFDPRLFAVKPHPGQTRVADWIHSDLREDSMPRNSSRLQDRYSLRCAPHVIGVLEDALEFIERTVQTELNSATDNPIVDAEGGHVMHGGHFYGGHIAFAMDSLKVAVANIADLVDRQIAQLVDVKFNHGLPANLSGASGAQAALHHGFKAVQIGASAWAAEALKNTLPASIFSRSTECHNQDKVSMGSIAARDCQRVLTLTEQVLAAGTLCAVQGIRLRVRAGALAEHLIQPQLRQFLAEVAGVSDFLSEDRALEAELRAVLGIIQARGWPLYG